MKVVLISLLLASTLCQANLAGLDCEYIPQKMSLQEELSIGVLDDVKRETGCGNEFKAYGTCCSLDSLKTQSAAMNTSLVSGVNTLKTEFVKFANIVSELDGLIKNQADADLAPGDEAYNAKIQTAKNIRDSKAMAFLRTSFNSSKSGDFNSSLDKCWGDVSKARNSALCTLCAGRSAAFVFNQNNVVIKDSDCTALATKCRDSLDNIRSFAQALTLYSTVFNAVLPPALSFHIDVSRINRNDLASIFEIVNSNEVESGLKGSNTEADNKICSAVLSAGKPVLVEAFKSVFNPTADYSLYSLDSSVKTKVKAVIARNGFDKSNLLSNFTNSLVAPPQPNSTEVNKLIADIKSRFSTLAAQSRRRRLQTIGTRVDIASYSEMIEDLKKSTSSWLNSDFFGFVPSSVTSGVGLTFGSQVNRYLSDSFRMVSESVYRKETGGSRVASYSAPPADNPPAFNRTGILDPVVLTPIDLTIS